MDRRRVLFGGAFALGSFAGCLGDPSDADERAADTEPDERVSETDEADGDGIRNGDGDPAGEDPADGDSTENEDVDTDDVPDAARETGSDVLEAILSGDDDAVFANVPDEHVDGDPAGTDWVIAMGTDDRWLPDDYEITLSDAAAVDDFARRFEPTVEFTADVDAEYVLEYAVDLETGDHRYDRDVRLLVLEIDGNWYGWTPSVGPLHPRPPQVGLDVDEGPKTVEITLGTLQGPGALFVRGGEIDDPTDYRLDDAGDSLAITADEVGLGLFEIVAAIGGPEGYATVLETFAFTDPSAWEGIAEIELEARLEGWIGLEPDHIEGIENPTLVLEAGRAYAVTWVNGDGATHDLQFRDPNDEFVDGYATEPSRDTETEQQLTVTATDELDSYVSEPSRWSMRGDVIVVDSFDKESLEDVRI